MNKTFCQSCGMPMDVEHFSTNEDGSANTTYCEYCFENGKFTKDLTMDQMIEQCLEYVDEFNKDLDQKLTKEEVRERMMQYFPQLLRWKN